VIKNENLKPFLRLKNVLHELAAYRALASVAKINGFQANIENEGILDVDGLMASARCSPYTEEWVDNHFLKFEKWLSLPDETLADQTVRDFLEESVPYAQTLGKKLADLD
jgi:hypothetical protein